MPLPLLNQGFNRGSLLAEVALKLSGQISLDTCDVLSYLLQGMSLAGKIVGTYRTFLCYLMQGLTLFMDIVLALLNCLTQSGLVCLDGSDL